MATYLVTGGAGFIGSNFVLYVLRKHADARVVNVDALTYAGNLENLADVEGDPRHTFVHADIRDAEAISAILATHDPDYVINFAAESHVDRSIENPGIFADTNVMGTVNLLNCCRAAWDDGRGGFGDHRYLQVGTDEVYGTLAIPEALNPDGSPADPAHTDYFREDTPLSPHSPYSASKCSADLFVKAYHDTYGFPALITRCSNNYGPYQFPEKLIPLMINNALIGRPLPVYGDGKTVRDWLYVEDHAKAIDMVQEKGRLFETYNMDHPQIVVTAFGTISRLCKSVIDQLKKSGVEVGLVRPITIWPFPYEAVRDAALLPGVKAVLDVEMNAGQMLEDVKIAVNGAKPVAFYGRSGAHMPTTREIKDKILKMLEE